MYKYVDKLGPKGDKSPALLVGTAVHKFFEGVLLEKDTPFPNFGPEYDEASEEVREEAVKAFAALTPALMAWQPKEKWEIVDVEKELRTTIKLTDGSEVELVGKLDTVIRTMGKLWHLQHKTIHASKPIDIFAETMRTDWHESAYQRLATEHYTEPFGGTILNCIRKLSAKRIADDPFSVFATFYLHRNPSLLSEEWADITALLDRMVWDITAYQTGIRPLKNRMACGGMFGNSLCKYKDVCDLKRPLEEMGFVTIEQRYEPSADGAGD
jgi:hypothetical protein